MSKQPIVIVISDLHVGGGTADQGDDHVYDQNQLRNFIDGLRTSPDGQAGRIELYINGDFLEFAQVGQDIYTLRSADAWCSESESRAKLALIVAGHRDIFDALKAFGAAGNLVTIAAGNHDVDLFWPGVQEDLRAVAGPVSFVLGADWTSRLDGRLRIAHGHQSDLANQFRRWSHPFVTGPDGEERLEMCPGTLFMVKFVNWLEGNYPFADNIKPVSALWRILAHENTLDLVGMAWMLARFAARHPGVTMGAEATDGTSLPAQLVEYMRNDPAIGTALRSWYRTYLNGGASNAVIDDTLRTDPDRLEALMIKVMAAEGASAWTAALGHVQTGPISLGDEQGTLQLAQSQKIDDRELFRQVAKRELAGKDKVVEAVVLGHTHCPDDVTWPELPGKRYFNPGSWTRYAEIEGQTALTLDDLKDESAYPYALNYVRIEALPTGLDARMLTYAHSPGGL